MNPIQTDQNLIQQIVSDRKIRASVASGSHYWFFNIYFSHYVKYPTAQFQKEIFSLTEQQDIRNIGIVAFRGSAKSTIMTLSYPIWSILGKQQKKFVVLLGQTQIKARQYLLNIKRELESNELLRNDLGPFKEETDEWGSLSLVIPKYGAKITAASADQSIRGLRHGPYRPDLLICDDVEDLTSVKTREGRDKIYSWLTGDVIPAGDISTRLIVIGNLLHEDSLLMRLKQNIEEGSLSGLFRAYPLVSGDDQILWPGKFPNQESIEDFKRSIGSESAWQREFLLHIMPEDDQIVFKDWIKYYDQLPDKEHSEYRFTWFGVDPAISLKATADYTAMIGAQVHGYGEDLRIYIFPNPINKRLTFPETIDSIKMLLSAHKDRSPKALIENVAYQASVFQQLQREGYSVEGVKILGDKRERLASITHLIQSGKILFPRQRAEVLIQQLVGFGIEKHEDLVDAFTLLIHKIIENNHGRPDIIWLDCGSSERGWRSVSSFEDLFRR